MSQDEVDRSVRQAMVGDAHALSTLVTQADASDEVLLITMAALVEGLPARLDRAGELAARTRDRQVVAIARAHLEGKNELVDALARDHLADYPDSLIVSWIAADRAARGWRDASSGGSAADDSTCRPGVRPGVVSSHMTITISPIRP